MFMVLWVDTISLFVVAFNAQSWSCMPLIITYFRIVLSNHGKHTSSTAMLEKAPGGIVDK